MNDLYPTKVGETEHACCAYFGEGVVFKGSVNAPEKVVVHGTADGEIIARDLLVGPTGTIRGNVSVDQADIQGKILEHIEAKVCLSLRKTGRIEGSATYGDIEIEKGGVLTGSVSTIKGSATIQTLPRQVVMNNSVSTSSDNKIAVANNLNAGLHGDQKSPLFNRENKK